MTDEGEPVCYFMTKNPKTPTKDHVDRWNDPREDCFENYAHDALGLVQVWEDEEHPVVKYHCQCSDFSKDLYCAHTSIFLNLVAYRYIKEEENRQIKISFFFSFAQNEK